MEGRFEGATEEWLEVGVGRRATCFRIGICAEMEAVRGNRCHKGWVGAGGEWVGKLPGTVEAKGSGCACPWD